MFCGGFTDWAIVMMSRLHTMQLFITVYLRISHRGGVDICDCTIWIKLLIHGLKPSVDGCNKSIVIRTNEWDDVRKNQCIDSIDLRGCTTGSNVQFRCLSYCCCYLLTRHHQCRMIRYRRCIRCKCCDDNFKRKLILCRDDKLLQFIVFPSYCYGCSRLSSFRRVAMEILVCVMYVTNGSGAIEMNEM